MMSAWSGSLRSWLWASLVACMSLALVLGCGHSVSPAGGYDDPSLIPMPTDLQAYVFGRRVELLWTAEDEVFRIIDGWNIYRAEGEMAPGEGAYVRLNDAVFNLARTFADLGIEDGHSYWYRLTSVSAAGVESFPTPAVSVRVDFTPPSPPFGVTANAGPASVTVSWMLAAEADLDHCNVFRMPPDPPFVSATGSPSTTVLVDNFGISPGDTLRYWVTAVDVNLNESVPSETVEVVVPGAGGVR